MRRVITAIALCLLLGLLTSIIVAWGAALSIVSSEADLFEFKATGWHGSIERTAAATRAFAVEQRYYADGREAPAHFGVRRQAAEPPNWLPVTESPQKSDALKMRGLSAGWPMRCLYCYITPTEAALFADWENGRHGVLSGVSLGALVVDNYANEDCELPLLPLFPGFVVNTIIYTAAWLLFVAWAYVCMRWRANHQRARNKCVQCRYDMRGADEATCPECGTDQMAPLPFVGRNVTIVLWMKMTLAAVVVLAVAGVVYFWPTPDQMLRAAYTSDLVELKKLHDSGADVNRYFEKARDIDGNLVYVTYTPLRAAVAGGSTDAVRWLIDHGADVNPRLHAAASPLGEAILHDHFEIAELLLESGSLVSPFPYFEKNLVWWAAINGEPVYIDLLAQHGVDYSIHSETLSQIIRESNGEISRTRTTSGTQRCLARMIKLGCPIPLDSYEWAIWSCDAGALNILLQHADEIPSTWTRSGRETTLLLEILDCKCNDDLIRVALDAGHDVNTSTSTGRAALNFAAESRPPSTVQLLLDHGADPNAQTTQGRTPIYWAVLSTDAEKVQLLLDAGADTSVLTDEDLSFTTPAIRELIESAR